MKNWMHHAVRACTVLLAAGVAHTALAASCATSAAPRAVDYPWMSIERWRQMHAEQVARAAQGGIDVMFVGDSLTEMWPKALWDSNFGHLKAANFGIGGDHTGNVLWRLQDPAIAAIKPKLVVLMIGVNNINLCKESADAVFGGIRAVVARLRAQYPAARILLNAVLPAGTAGSDVRRRLVALNRRVRTLNDGETVFFRDYGARFMGADGNLSKELQPDLLHFSEKGYRLLADAMRPDIEQLLAPKPYVAVSPDGRTRLKVTAGEGKLAYTVTRDGATVIAQSPLGLSTSLGTLDGQSLRVDGSDSKVVSETYRPVAGKAASVADHYNEVELRLVGKDQPFKLNVLARSRESA
jgi:lysophospholipase L1-like esterase